jgi:hypothetical protein
MNNKRPRKTYTLTTEEQNILNFRKLTKPTIQENKHKQQASTLQSNHPNQALMNPMMKKHEHENH